MYNLPGLTDRKRRGSTLEKAIIIIIIIIAAAAPVDTTQIVVDLARVAFCDSAGLATLLRAQREAAEQGTTVRIANQRGIVARVLDVTGCWKY